MLFVIGAMAVLAIDVASFYTARSEAQLAADSGALAGARVLANSGVTSAPGGTLSTNAHDLATAIATQVASQNHVGGRQLQATEVNVTIQMTNGQGYNPLVTVQVTRTDLPTFFARIWGDTIATVTASATAEAYNPSGAALTINGPPTPVASTCVKPFVLPNLDANNNPIFAVANGQVLSTSLVGSPIALQSVCGGAGCALTPTASGWNYFPGDPESTFGASTQPLPRCDKGEASDYQVSIAGCAPQPIACGGSINSTVDLYTTVSTDTGQDVSDAVNCLTHSESNGGDQLLPNPPDSSKPFQFVAGSGNPVVRSGPTAAIALVSDSLVTVPVANVTQTTGWTSALNVPIIGYLQVFLNPLGTESVGGTINGVITNVVGCGTAAPGNPIVGNGPSAVAVRLIHP
jgi:Flp pilus assembly protein TadG